MHPNLSAKEMSMPAAEVNFDGLVGPTHNYAGLSLGNVASMSHRGATSNPRAAALQGLAKMKFMAELGVPQAVLPPHERPSIATLRAFGFSGSDSAVLRAAARNAPELLRACASASGMWVANAATVCPSADSADGRVHLTPANLISKLHRSIEPPQTGRILRAIFRAPEKFIVHNPVPAGQGIGDEGAANHTRLAPAHGRRGLHLFVYGHRSTATARDARSPRRFPSRQACEASAAVARLHLLHTHQVVFAAQNSDAIDAGVFHNDVISVGNEGVFLVHEQAFARQRALLRELRGRYAALRGGSPLAVIEVPAARVPLAAAVRTYLFNSQLVTLAAGGMALVAPDECRRSAGVRLFLNDLLASGRTAIRQVHYIDLRQSMRNGGGPACLRLRVVLRDDELAALPAGVRLSQESHRLLVRWVEKHYRHELKPGDLADPALLEESRRALDELTQLLGLGSIYPFQLAG
jgi:succinylarginine dihydrolase